MAMDTMTKTDALRERLSALQERNRLLKQLRLVQQNAGGSTNEVAHHQVQALVSGALSRANETGDLTNRDLEHIVDAAQNGEWAEGERDREACEAGGRGGEEGA